MYANTYIHVYTYIYIVNVGFMFTSYPQWILQPLIPRSPADPRPFQR